MAGYNQGQRNPGEKEPKKLPREPQQGGFSLGTIQADGTGAFGENGGNEIDAHALIAKYSRKKPARVSEKPKADDGRTAAKPTKPKANADAADTKKLEATRVALLAHFTDKRAAAAAGGEAVNTDSTNWRARETAPAAAENPESSAKAGDAPEAPRGWQLLVKQIAPPSNDDREPTKTGRTK